MSDKVLSCTVEKNASEEVIQYHISYDVEHADARNNFCVVIKAEDLTDPSDLTEVVAKASLKAKEIKDQWILTIPSPVSEAVDSVTGDVTL